MLTRSDEELIELHQQWRSDQSCDKPAHEYMEMTFTAYVQWRNRVRRDHNYI